MSKKKINAKDLVAKIEGLMRNRILAQDVVSLVQLKKRPLAQTLLVVEDDDILRRSLIRIFEGEGYRVLAVQDAAELSEVLENSIIDLILMDVGLPWIDGFELAEMMKAHDETRRIPIVFLSGHADKEMIRRGFSVGADDYITKPFEVETVTKTIRTLLELQS